MADYFLPTPNRASVLGRTNTGFASAYPQPEQSPWKDYGTSVLSMVRELIAPEADSNVMDEINQEVSVLAKQGKYKDALSHRAEEMMATMAPYMMGAGVIKGVKSYHGSDALYDTMNTTDRALDQSIPNALGDNIGAFFADNTNHAKDFGKNVKAYRVDLKNPKVFKTQDDFRAFIRENSGRTPDTRDAEGFITKEGVFEHKARKTLEEQGYDGVVITRPNYTKSKKSDQPWRIAFDESQVSDWDDKATE